MRKIFIACICILIFITLPLFAEWKIGNVVDDFGDPTGEKFVYTFVDGTFSNSATASSPCFIRVLAQYEVKPFPKEKWVFEIHEYDLNNPVNNFSSSSDASIKFKDDSGKVYSYDTKNFKYANYWNILAGTKGLEFTNLLFNNQNIKAAVVCESTRYNFEIPTSGARDVLTSVKSAIAPNTRKWIKEDIDPLMLEIYEYFAGEFKRLGAKKTFPTYTWKYYDVVNVSGAQYEIQLSITDEDLAINGYADFNISAYSLDENKFTVKSYGGIKTVTFNIDGKDYSLIRENPEKDTSFKNIADIKKITEALDSSAVTRISISVVENKPPLTIALSGKEMARIINSL